jgi:hypothetical protein
VTLKPHTSPLALPTPKVPMSSSGRQLGGVISNSRESVTSVTQQGTGQGRYEDVGVEFSPFMGMGRGVNLSDSSGELEAVQPPTPPSGGTTAAGTAARMSAQPGTPAGASSGATPMASRDTGPALSPFAIAAPIEPEGAAAAGERSSRRSGVLRSQSENQRMPRSVDESGGSSLEMAVPGSAGGARPGGRGDTSPRSAAAGAGVPASTTRASSRSAVLHYPRSQASGTGTGSASPGVGNTPQASTSPKAAPASPETRGSNTSTASHRRAGGHSMTQLPPGTVIAGQPGSNSPRPRIRRAVTSSLDLLALVSSGGNGGVLMSERGAYTVGPGSVVHAAAVGAGEAGGYLMHPRHHRISHTGVGPPEYGSAGGVTSGVGGGSAADPGSVYALAAALGVPPSLVTPGSHRPVISPQPSQHANTERSGHSATSPTLPSPVLSPLSRYTPGLARSSGSMGQGQGSPAALDSPRPHEASRAPMSTSHLARASASSAYATTGGFLMGSAAPASPAGAGGYASVMDVHSMGFTTHNGVVRASSSAAARPTTVSERHRMTLQASVILTPGCLLTPFMLYNSNVCVASDLGK